MKIILKINVSCKKITMTLYYAVAKGNQAGIFTTSLDLKKSIVGYPGAMFQMFSNEDDAKSFLQSFEKNIQIIHTRSEVKTEDDCIRLINIRKCFVVYITTENYKGKEFYKLLIKNKDDKIIFNFGHSEDMKPTSKTSAEICGIMFVLEKFDEPVTFYTQNRRVVDLCNKFLPLWKKMDWDVTNPPPDFELIQNLANKIENRKVEIKSLLNASLPEMKKLKMKHIRDNYDS